MSKISLRLVAAALLAVQALAIAAVRAYPSAPAIPAHESQPNDRDQAAVWRTMYAAAMGAERA